MGLITFGRSRLHRLMTEIVRPEEREILDQTRHIMCPKGLTIARDAVTLTSLSVSLGCCLTFRVSVT